MRNWTYIMPLLALTFVACEQTRGTAEVRERNKSRHLEIVFSGNREGDKLFPESIFLEGKKQDRTYFTPNDPASVEQSAFLIMPAWSSDERWLVLPDGRFEGFLAFESDGLPEDIENKGKGRRIGVSGANGTKWWHEFVEWRSPKVFRFRAGLSGDFILFDYSFDSHAIEAIGNNQVEYVQIPGIVPGSGDVP